MAHLFDVHPRMDTPDCLGVFTYGLMSVCLVVMLSNMTDLKGPVDFGDVPQYESPFHGKGHSVTKALYIVIKALLHCTRDPVGI